MRYRNKAKSLWDYQKARKQKKANVSRREQMSHEPYHKFSVMSTEYLCVNKKFIYYFFFYFVFFICRHLAQNTRKNYRNQG